jgi:hypothetical protein
VLMIITPDFLDVEITRKDLLNKEVLTWKERIIMYQRVSSIGISAFIQHIIYAIFKKGKKKIEEYEEKNGIKDNASGQ